MEVSAFSLTLTLIHGKRPLMDERECREAGRLLSILHGADIIHGDYTPANLIAGDDGVMHVIDFGLGYISKDIEDMAVDVFTMLRAVRGLPDRQKKAFVDGYSSFKKADSVMKRVAVVESRVRYAI
jgi:Kae1-associated kinase Bud32